LLKTPLSLSTFNTKLINLLCPVFPTSNGFLQDTAMKAYVTEFENFVSFVLEDGDHWVMKQYRSDQVWRDRKSIWHVQKDEQPFYEHEMPSFKPANALAELELESQSQPGFESTQPDEGRASMASCAAAGVSVASMHRPGGWLSRRNS
jgi:hypothetical protein